MRHLRASEADVLDFFWVSLNVEVLELKLVAVVAVTVESDDDSLPIRSSQALSSSGRGGPLKWVGFLGLAVPSSW